MKTIKINYTKPPLSFKDQLNKLKKRGLRINHEEYALDILSRINYYRLSAYWLPFKQKNASGHMTDAFQKGIEFGSIVELYEFDRKLRLLVMDALERVEISIRTSITYFLAHKYGAFALHHAENFHPQFNHPHYIQKIHQEIGRSRESFIEHFQEKYSGFPQLPVWMATEVISFGALSVLFRGLKNEDKRAIAQDNYNLHPKTLANWLHFLTYIRNVCAHHSRLWNKELAIRPKIEGLDTCWLPPVTPKHDRSFFALLILKYLLNHSNNTKEWMKNCEALIFPILSNYPWSRTSMGVIDDFNNHPIWNMG
jgi:abortive infection bacteriophage resistance protein